MKVVRKPLVWIGSTREDLKDCPAEVQDFFGQALDIAQQGLKHKDAKPMQGFGGAGVLEIVEDFKSDTFRAVYTVRFAEILYVLHVFKKKSKQGIKTPRQDIELIKKRLRIAEGHYKIWLSARAGRKY
jgi:phage-related protein